MDHGRHRGRDVYTTFPRSLVTPYRHPSLCDLGLYLFYYVIINGFTMPCDYVSGATKLRWSGTDITTRQNLMKASPSKH